MKRAYSTFEIKSIHDDEDERVIEGLATTPEPDRLGDIVESDGAEFKLPIPFLWQHNSREPIGHVTSAKVTKDGISIVAKFVRINEPGKLKERLDEAWQSIKSGLVRGLSIGFRSLEESQIKDTFSYRYLRWAWLETSAVTIPANASASIQTIKSADQALLAASGERGRSRVRVDTRSPGATGSTAAGNKRGNAMKTIKEQIGAFEATRAAKAARMTALMADTGEKGETLDEAGAVEYDGLKDEVAQVDEHLARLNTLDAINVAKAAPVAPAAGIEPAAAARVRAGDGVRVKSNLLPGMPFVRYVKALAMARGNVMHAHAIAVANQEWKSSSPEVAMVLKAAVDAGDTTTANWASELVYNQNLLTDFIEFLRPQTIIGRITGLRRVPFNVRMGSQTAGSTGYWVGQGRPVPVSKLTTGEATLGITKCAGLVVLTEELVRSSSPSAEALVRDDLTRTLVALTDVSFIDPNQGGLTNIQPASITYGVTANVPSGATAAAFRTDFGTLFADWITNNLSPEGAVLVMTPTIALRLSLLMNSLGQPEFPTIGLTGGVVLGVPVVVSQSAYIAGSPDFNNIIVLINAPEVMLADDGQVVIDASREAALEMLDNPTNQSSATATATSMVSMFQTESVAIKAVRYINWAKRRTFAVDYIRGAVYSG